MAFRPAINFTDYTPPTGPGAPYAFDRGDGSPPLMFAGPEAERVAALIDRQRPDPRLAQNSMTNPDGSLIEPGQMGGRADAGAPPPMTRINPGSGVLAPPPEAPPAAVAPPPPPATPGMPTPAALAAADTSKQITGTAVDYPTDAPPMPKGPLPMLPGAAHPEATAKAPVPQLDLTDRLQGGGYDPRRDAARRFPVPEELTVEKTGGVPDPQAREAIGKAYEDEAHAKAIEAATQRALSEAQLHAADAARAKAETDAAMLQKQADDAAAERARIVKAQDDWTAAADAEAAEAAKQHEDPYRIFRGKPGNQIVATLAMMIGGFGQGSGLTRNNAGLDIIQRAVDQDVDSQKREIADGKVARNNRIAHIQAKYGYDLATAENAYRFAVNAQLANKATVIAAGQQSQDAQLNLAKAGASFAETQRKLMEQAHAALQGEVTKTTERSKMLAPHAGGMDTLAAWNRRAGIAEAQARIAKAGFEVGHEGSAPPKAGASGPGELPRTLKTFEAINESAQQDIREFIETRKGLGLLVPGTEAYNKVHAKILAIAGKAVQGSNNSISESELQQFKEALGGTREGPAVMAAEAINEALKTAHSGAERQRGNGGPSLEDAISEAGGQQ